VTAAFTIEVLGAGEGRKSFRSGVDALDRYLRETASQDVKRRVSNCFVARDANGMIAGYYTFAASSVPLLDLPAETVKKLPRYGVIPAGLIGRLAVDQAYRGRGLGGALVMDAVRKAGSASPAVFALIVDAKDEAARGFYERLGFLRLASREMSLFLPIATAMAAF
jgi:ribosomal protein S18 acetylase RimI-like enzyme